MLDKIAAAVKTGVLIGDGTPIEITTIGVCDGIAMNHVGMKYSLVSRETIADLVEIAVAAHAFDAVVLIPNCDKVIPGSRTRLAPTSRSTTGPRHGARMPLAINSG